MSGFRKRFVLKPLPNTIAIVHTSQVACLFFLLILLALADARWNNMRMFGGDLEAYMNLRPINAFYQTMFRVFWFFVAVDCARGPWSHETNKIYQFAVGNFINWSLFKKPFCRRITPRPSFSQQAHLRLAVLWTRRCLSASPHSCGSLLSWVKSVLTRCSSRWWSCRWCSWCFRMSMLL